MTWQVEVGDCREVLAGLPDNSFEAVVSDPPYGLSFMGKGWDHQVPGVEFWSEFLRVAKPGAHLLAFGGTRTWHRMAVAIEDAGWEIRDTMMWLYGSGFPKSHNIGKAIDKAAGAKREVVGVRNRQTQGWEPKGPCKSANVSRLAEGTAGLTADVERGGIFSPLTAPATDLARQWDGWGTAMKPAWEPIIVARKKPEGTVAGNVERWGCGGLNVDGCRIGSTKDVPGTPNSKGDTSGYCGGWGDHDASMGGKNPNLGRWPANLILDPEAGAVLDEQAGDASVNKPAVWRSDKGGPDAGRIYENGSIGKREAGQIRNAYGDTGGPSRFFYCPKASKADRNSGCEGMEERFAPTMGNGIGGKEHDPETATPKANHHPTVKPTDLMRYLCRLVTPPGGTVLDPFTGSGSTGKAAVAEGFNFFGCELSPEYADIARARIGHEANEPSSLWGVA